MKTQTEQLNEHIRNVRAMAYIARIRAERAMRRAGFDHRRRLLLAAILTLPFYVVATMQLWHWFR